MHDMKFYAIIDYEDPDVQSKILSALRSQLPESAYKVVNSINTIDDKSAAPILQIRAYEAIDFEFGLHNPNSLFNAYIIRKGLIRKHYLSNVMHTWLKKHPESGLRHHYEPAEAFELDYAEFLDEALLEAYDLTSSLAINEDQEPEESEWWILKPSLSDRGQGIRLFRTEDDLRAIFEQWEAENPDTDTDTDKEEGGDDENDTESGVAGTGLVKDYIVTSHLRHFVAQRYIEPPLLFPSAPYNNRKFHIRTYVVATGALKVYVYEHMLALFASEAYQPPWATGISESGDRNGEFDLEQFRNIHLTNTCLQKSTSDAVHLLSSLPLPADAHTSIVEQINTVILSVFCAAAAQPTNFQPLPQAFEIFGLDFLVDTNFNVWLLEVNAFPDFAQTGKDLGDLVVGGLFQALFKTIVGPHFGIQMPDNDKRLKLVLDVDLGFCSR